jgi:general secretion pathway protein N
MMRVWPLLIGLAIGLAAMLPARLLLPAPPLSATSTAGSLWHATLAGAAIGPARLGTVVLKLQPGAFAQGRLQWQVTGGVSGALFHSMSGGGGEALAGTLSGAVLPGLPLAAIGVADTSILLDVDGRCRSASGQVTATLAVALAGQTSLTGAARCDASALLLPLASPDGRVRLDLRFDAQGWQARLGISGAPPAEAMALAAGGFGRSGGEFVLNRESPW